MALTPFHGEIYVHTCTANGKSYVGQTTAGMEKRWAEHIRHSRSSKCADSRYPLSRAIRKYGPTTFESQVISVARTKPELDNLEKVWIILLQTRETGYNITAGGEGAWGLRHTAAAKAKISTAHLGNKYCLGRKCSLASRAKQSQAVRGRVLSSEWRAKIAAAGRGRQHSAATRAKISTGNTGKIFSIETREKMSAAAKGHKRGVGRKLSPETHAKMSASQRARQARERLEKSNG
jgi:group I intron endonuclease